MEDVLESIRVIELSESIAGSIVGMFLSDYGADVVKVERPTGDPLRTNPGFAVWGRGKRSVTIDPDVLERRGFLNDLISGADVIITGDRTELERFGLDLFDVAEAHPRLVVLELPPYLPGYTPWNGSRESAHLLAATLGMAARQTSRSGEPVDSIYPTLSYTQGLWATCCLIAALIEREASGTGQIVTVTGANSVQVLSIMALSTWADAPDPNMAMGGRGFHPTYGRVLAGDGHWLISGAIGSKFESKALQILQVEDLLDDPRTGGLFYGLFHPDLLPQAIKRVDDAFLARPAHEWEQVFESASIPSAVILDRDEWLDHPQVEATGLRAELDDPERGHVVMPGIPVALTQTPGRVRGPAPRLGEHDDIVIDWAPQLAPTDGRSPVQPGPLSGLRVLAAGSYVAGPYSASLLAELGADVIKIEPLGGDPFRATGYQVNRGPRSIALDLQRPEGLAVFNRLVESADVVLDGLRPGLVKKLGIDYDSLRQVNPAIISHSLSGFGEVGPISQRGAVDMILQGMSGMMIAEGGGDAPIANTIALIDITTGQFNVLAVALALFRRARTGRGQRTWTSLLASATFLQLAELTRFPGRPKAIVGSDDFRGPAAFDRLYECADGWIRIYADSDAAGRRAVAEAYDTEVPEGETDAQATLAGLFRDIAASDALLRLNSAGLPTVAVRQVGDLARDPRLVAAGFVGLTTSTDGRQIIEPTRTEQFGRTMRTTDRRLPGVGEHTAEILRGAGYSADEVSELIQRGVISQGGPAVQQLGQSYR